MLKREDAIENITDVIKVLEFYDEQWYDEIKKLKEAIDFLEGQVEEIIFDSEEVTFTFEDKDYSAIVDFYGEDDWKLQSLAMWNDKEKEWETLKVSQNKIWVTNTKRLTEFMNNRIDEYGNNAFETAYTAQYEPTDWKDDYE